MIRLPVLCAVFASFVVAAPAIAQTPAGYYVATPVAAPAKRSLITRTTLWAAQGPAYVATRSPERAMILCQLVARDAGTLAGFTIGGAAMPAEDLAKCNAKAR